MADALFHIGACADRGGRLLTAVTAVTGSDVAAGVQVYHFSAGLATREPRATLPGLKNPTLLCRPDGIVYLAATLTSRDRLAAEVEPSPKVCRFLNPPGRRIAARKAGPAVMLRQNAGSKSP